jgi:hypothetical protein
VSAQDLADPGLACFTLTAPVGAGHGYGLPGLPSSPTCSSGLFVSLR